MPKYRVTVRRIVREDTVIEVEAETPRAADWAAHVQASDVPPEKWDCYDCEYWSDEDAIVKV